MKRDKVPQGTLRPRSRIARWICLLIIGYVTLRRLVSGAGFATLPVSIGLLVAYSVLFLLSSLLAGRARRYIAAYLILQIVIIEALGLVPPYEDTWVMLYIPLGVQIMQVYPFRQALAWGGLFSVLLTGTLIFTSGWIYGLGFGLYYIAIGIFFIAYDTQSTRSEAARQESQELLAEREAAHARLQEYSAQAGELAALQEHNRLRRELHDSVSQIIFSITLNAQTTQLLLDKNPERVPEQLDRLQELTSGALSQMRALISQWRPG